jgi:hypothetical protein
VLPLRGERILGVQHRRPSEPDHWQIRREDVIVLGSPAALDPRDEIIERLLAHLAIEPSRPNACRDSRAPTSAESLGRKGEVVWRHILSPSSRWPSRTSWPVPLAACRRTASLQRECALCDCTIRLSRKSCPRSSFPRARDPRSRRTPTLGTWGSYAASLVRTPTTISSASSSASSASGSMSSAKR